MNSMQQLAAIKRDLFAIYKDKKLTDAEKTNKAYERLIK